MSWKDLLASKWKLFGLLRVLSHILAEEPVACQNMIDMHKAKEVNINIWWCFTATSQYSKFSDTSECFLFT